MPGWGCTACRCMIAATVASLEAMDTLRIRCSFLLPIILLFIPFLSLFSLLFLPSQCPLIALPLLVHEYPISVFARP